MTTSSRFLLSSALILLLLFPHGNVDVVFLCTTNWATVTTRTRRIDFGSIDGEILMDFLSTHDDEYGASAMQFSPHSDDRSFTALDSDSPTQTNLGPIDVRSSPMKTNTYLQIKGLTAKE
uniref:DOMON domain-containing protein n=1 Tax=Anopheles atroparvus TaxID=41427 RepID=A0A182J2X3_ANOAO